MNDTSDGHGGKGIICLAACRVVLGFMMIWGFLDKMFGLGFPSTSDVAYINGGSPTEFYLSQLVDGPFEDMWNSLAGNGIVDALLMIGLLLVGLSLILGIASKLGTIGMCVMMILMYTLVLPPSDNPLVTHHIVYILATLAIYFLGAFDEFSLGKQWKSLSLVKRFPTILE